MLFQILQDFCQLNDKNEALLYNAIDKIILKLGKFFSMSITNETSKIDILKCLHEKLTTTKFRKVNEPLISIEEVTVLQKQ